MIIEGLLTTTDEDGRPHVAPMGPCVDPQLQRWLLRPWATSTTYRLLRANPHCVFHVVDDVVPVVESALGLASSLHFERHEATADAAEQPAAGVWIIPDACHWYHLHVTSWETCQPRAEAEAEVLEHQVLRPFWGWNRAKHAVLEATILATRLHLAERRLIDQDLARLQPAIDKTAGPRELVAWQMLQDFFESN